MTRTVKAGSVTTGTRGSAPYCQSCDDDLCHLNKLFYSELNFCGCGNPEDAYDLVGTVLGLLEENREQDDADPEKFAFYPDSARMKRGKAFREATKEYIGGNDGTFNLIMYLLGHVDLTEHGGSIYGSWITKKGRHYLSLMNRYQWDDVDQTGSPHDGGDCGPGCVHWEDSTEDWQKKGAR